MFTLGVSVQAKASTASKNRPNIFQNLYERGGSVVFPDNVTGILYLQKLQKELQAHNELYRLHTLNFPRAFATMPNSLIKVKKGVFIQSLLPLIEEETSSIVATKSYLKTIQNLLSYSYILRQEDTTKVSKILEEYNSHTASYYKGLIAAHTSQSKRVVLNSIKSVEAKLQPIPTSLVLAIAIHETGWGVSRFLQEGNSLFSQVGYRSLGQSVILPRSRKNNNLGVRCYKSLQEAIKSFMYNLNSGKRYCTFRNLRNIYGQNSNKLALGLNSYAVMPHYPQLIIKIIALNKLIKYDTQVFRGGKLTRYKPHKVAKPPIVVSFRRGFSIP